MAYINPPGIPVERGKVHEFANAILDDNPLYHDNELAKSAGLPGVVAPPTFTSVGAHFPSPDGGGGGLAGLDIKRALHGGQEFIFERPIMAGDILTSEPGATRQYEKEGRRGGKLKFVETESVYRDQKGQVVVRIKNTLIETGQVVEA